MSNVQLIILLIAAMGATVYALVRGIITFLRTTEEELKNGQAGPSQSSLRQNKAMMARITFQAAAVFIVAIILLMNGSK